MGVLVAVGEAAELQENVIHKVEHDGAVIAVVRLGDEFYAVDGKCSHAGGPLCRGEINAEDKSISCPWHGWEYDLTSGDCLFDDSLKQQTFSVQINDGTVFIAVE